MTFWRRLKLYGFGFAIGLVIVYAMFGNRSCATPGEIKMRELAFQYHSLSDKAKCKLRCLKINEQLLKIQLRHFEIDYGKSNVQQQPCGMYFVKEQQEHAGKYGYDLVMYDCDTITRIDDIHIIKSIETCTCQ